MHRHRQSTATTTWAYDANGNRTAENGQTIANYDNQDRLLKWRNNTYQYNTAGDLSQKTTPAGINRYSYDAQGNLRSVTLANGKTITYAIDPANRRTGKTINGQLQWQLVWLDGLKPLARLKPDNTLDQIYYYADKVNVPGAMSKDGKNYRIISDQNGSVRLVIDANTGEVAQQMDYDTWGNVTTDTNPGFQPFGFAGGLYDPDTGLTRFGARDYDAETGRWTAKDPILFAGGDSNLYGYVLQDPVNFKDSTGLLPSDAQKIVDKVMKKYCGNARDAHDDLLMERIKINWEATSEYGDNLRLAENYLTNYSQMMNPASGEYTPRPLVYFTQAMMTPIWQAKRVVENKLGYELQSPASLKALNAGYEGATDAFSHYLTNNTQYDCTCKK